MTTAASTLGGRATIAASRTVFTLINTFDVEPANQQTLIDELAAVTESTMRTIAGFVGASVHRGLDGTHVINYVQWASRAHFEAMLRDPRVQPHLERVQSIALAVRPVFCAVAFVGTLESPP